MKYYLSVEMDYEVYEDDFDGDDYTGFNHDGYVNHFFMLSKEEYGDGTLIQTFETKLDNPHFVVIIYSDGGTFGRTDGYVQALPPVDQDHAYLIKKIVEEVSSNYENKEQVNSKVLALLKECGHDRRDFNLSINSYFARLQEVVILKYE